MNKNDSEKLRFTFFLSLDGFSVKALIHYYGGRFIFVVRIIRVASSGNAP